MKRTATADRLRILRKTLKLNQTEFAKNLQMTQASVSAMQSGKASITDKTISLLCLKYDVNENWLRNGVDPMFNSYSPLERNLVELLEQLSPERQRLAVKIIKTLVDDETQSSKPE
jgi:transcriptional regulator with XRE-family HTH domain